MAWRSGHARVHAQPPRTPAGVAHGHIGRLRFGLGEGLERQLEQRQPARLVRQVGQGRCRLQVQQLARRGVGRAHAGQRIDHEHTVRQSLHHELVHLRLQPGRLDACERQLLLAHEPRSQLVGQEGHEQVAQAGQTGLQIAPRGLGQAVRGTPPGLQQQQGRDGQRHADGHGPGAQHRGEQHGHAEQWCVADGGGLEQLQQRDDQHVHAHRQQPGRVQRVARQVGAHQQPRAQGAREVQAAHAQHPGRHGVRQHVQQGLQQRQGQRDGRSRGHEAVPGPRHRQVADQRRAQVGGQRRRGGGGRAHAGSALDLAAVFLAAVRALPAALGVGQRQMQAAGGAARHLGGLAAAARLVRRRWGAARTPQPQTESQHQQHDQVFHSAPLAISTSITKREPT